MELRIGVMNAPKEIVLDIDDDKKTSDKVAKDVEAAIAAAGVLWVEDSRGRRVAVPADRLAYVEFGSPDDHRVGFGVG
ncbi:MAG: DUF3107 domain-containing protein [Acidimicrobiales bacterium]